MLWSLLWHRTFRELMSTVLERLIRWISLFHFDSYFLNFLDHSFCFSLFLYNLFLCLHFWLLYVYRSCWSFYLLDWLCNSTFGSCKLLLIYATIRLLLSMILDLYCAINLRCIAIREPRHHLIWSFGVVILCLLIRDCPMEIKQLNTGKDTYDSSFSWSGPWDSDLAWCTFPVGCVQSITSSSTG